MSTEPTPTALPDVESSVRLSDLARGARRYAPPGLGGPIDLHLDANEGRPPELSADELASIAEGGRLGRYPRTEELEGSLAARLGVRAEQVIVTAGGDDAIDRVCRVALEPGRELILPVPTFEMIGKYARQAGATVITTPWPTGLFPRRAVIEAVNERTGMIAVVSPNNPTGAVATAEDLVAVSAAAPRAVILADLAYGEFAEEDLTALATRELANVVVIRTFSKALGLAGARVGYAVGPEPIIAAMRAVGAPFAVAGPSVQLAMISLGKADRTLASVIPVIRSERARLTALLSELGATARVSQANFVLAEVPHCEWVWRALAGLGIAVRRFAAGTELDGMLRISLPGNAKEFERLCGGLRAAMRPEALLFDMDGVLADVSQSYRRAILMTAETFGVRLSAQTIGAAKAAGDANNDWVLTTRLVNDAGVKASLWAVTERFEALYHGTAESPGLELTERLIASRALLERLAERLPLAVVTGRPRADCERFLARFELAGIFKTAVCMEDGPAKPAPDVVQLALSRLGVQSAWMIGDTPDDVVAARRAGVVPIGIAAPGDEAANAARVLGGAGAAMTLSSLEQLEGLFP